MYPMTHLLSVSTDGQDLLDRIIPSLRGQGWQVVRSFDLQTARQAHTACTCPHHGTRQCDCRMSVFLLYGEVNPPLTLIAHGRDGLTELALVDDPAQNSSPDQVHKLRQFLQQQNLPLSELSDAAGLRTSEATGSANPAVPAIDQPATALTQQRYQRLAPYYDWMEKSMEAHFLAGRKRMWAGITGGQVLEVGVGTGRNIEYYPPQAEVTAIDLTPGMLERARRRADELDKAVDLRQMDVQRLEFPDGAFDTVVSACVFCSVPDPLLGLQEVRRVTRPGGKVILLEHVRSPRPGVGKLMDLLNPFVVRVMGANINRRTVENVERAGLKIERVESLGMGGIVKLIFASRA